MHRGRLLRKLLTGLASFAVLVTVLVVVVVAQQVRSLSVEETRRSLDARAALLSEIAGPALRDGSVAALRERLVELGRGTGSRYTVLSTDGTVVADSHDAPAALGNQAGRADVVEALASGQGEELQNDSTGRHLSRVVPLGPRKAPAGLVRVTMSLDAAEGRRLDVGRLMLLALTLVLPLTLVVGLWLSHRIAVNVSALADTARNLAGGHSAPRLDIRTRDELEDLAEALNHIGASSSAQLEATRTERNRVLAILSGMVEGVVAIDREERVVHINTTAARILRCAPAAVGKRIWELTRVREVSEALSEALREQQVVNREARIVLGRNEQVIELHAAPLDERGGRPGGAVVVLHDITELRRLEDIRREFVANVSHELKTPLTAIGALVETLIDDTAMDAETHGRFLVKIREQAARLSTMVRDLLNLSRIESRELKPELERVDLRRTLSTNVRMMTPNAEKKGVRLELSLPEDPLPVLAEEESLHHLVSNLLENAIKYTPEAGRVLVSAGIAEGGAFIEVQDTGIGIPPAHHERIFERFYRVDKGRSRDVGGTGLGLSIVKHIALAHGGRVSVDSEPGRGSTFRVVLPLAGLAG